MILIVWLSVSYLSHEDKPPITNWPYCLVLS